MKMLFIVYNDILDEALVAALKNSGVSGYTKWTNTIGEGPGTEPKLSTHVWPGKNDVIAAVVADEDLARVTATLRQLTADHPKVGIRTFVMPVEGMI